MENRTAAEGIDRRTIIKGAAWSLPVIAVAAAVPATAASTATDLVPALSGTVSLTFSAIVPVATITTPDTLTITNSGSTPSSAGALVHLQYNASLLTLNVGPVAGVTVSGSDGNLTLTLPSIPAGGQLVFDLGTTLDSLLTVTVLNSIIGGPTPTVVATVTGDTVTGNNVASSNVGIQLL